MVKWEVAVAGRPKNEPWTPGRSINLSSKFLDLTGFHKRIWLNHGYNFGNATDSGDYVKTCQVLEETEPLKPLANNDGNSST